MEIMTEAHKLIPGDLCDTDGDISRVCTAPVQRQSRPTPRSCASSSRTRIVSASFSRA
jgi:hypothetical protein